ncbi:DUF3560 domain-containing protein [Streptomyces erythrochromogenes]|uniref:DUF3560 domain-containing protein n=1 Tax=Streptomyces erythrochromogenes TaxID=285574 RepID=UPI0036D066B3
MTIKIVHTRANGTILHGSVKGDGVFEIVRTHGFWFSRNVDGLYIRRSQDRDAQAWRINAAAEALRAAGHEVTIEINEDDRRSFTEAEADRETRADERADRFSGRADWAASSSNARYGTAKKIADGIPFGQPILVDHHSAGRARRDAERIDTNMRKSIEDGKRASYWSDRARAAENYKKHRNDPYRTVRRLMKLRAELRQQERYHAEAIENSYPSAGQHSRLILDLTEEIAHWEEVVVKAEAEGVKVWGPEDFAPGDFALCRGSWYQVKRVNPKTLSIAWNLRLAPKKVMTLKDATDNGRVSTHPADYTDVRARCPEAATIAFLADGKVPGTTSAREASEATPADAVRTAQAEAKKAKPKKKADPRVPRAVRVQCRWDATEATLTFLNGRNQPHKDHQQVTISAADGVKFTESVWSRPLLDEVTTYLTGRGFTYGHDGWRGGPGRGIVRAIAPVEAEREPAGEMVVAPLLPVAG